MQMNRFAVGVVLVACVAGSARGGTQVSKDVTRELQGRIDAAWRAGGGTVRDLLSGETFPVSQGKVTGTFAPFRPYLLAVE